MEDLKNRRKKREGRHRDTWDPFRLNPAGSEKEEKRRCFVFAQHLVAVIVGLLVLTSAVISKGSLLVLCMFARPNSKTSKGHPFYLLMLVFCLVVPNVMMFLKSLWKCAFKNFVTPNMKTMGMICLIEALVSLGTSLLVLISMPQFDFLTNLFLSGGICFLSSLLQIIFRLQKESWKIIFPICSVILIISGYSLLAVDFYARESSYVPNVNKDCYLYVAIAIFASILVSFNWWENPLQASGRIQETLTELDGFRDFVFVITSILRLAVISSVYTLYFQFFQPAPVKWTYFSHVPEEVQNLGVGLFFLQAFSSVACHWFGVVACKINAIRFSFAFPIFFSGPSVLIIGVALFITQSGDLDGIATASFTSFCSSLGNIKNQNMTAVVLSKISESFCMTFLNSHYKTWPFTMLVMEGLFMWLALLCATYYVWNIKVQRIERTSQLFVRRLYESAFIDQSMLLNTKMKVNRVRNQEYHNELESCVIYLCATMWHETYDEMLKILTSMFRLDRYRGDPKKEHKDNFDFECHIFVDDSFKKDKDSDSTLVNEYVNDLTHVIIEVYRVFTNKEPDDVSIIETPYGGRLLLVMPEGNMLYIHLKDKQLIRNKKRWSQIMYLYYLLGWKGYIAKNPQKITRQNDPCRASLVSLDGESFLLPTYGNDSKRRHISDDNTYILALDGDTDFHPAALILLVDRLRMYENVGAACGRIHPTGMGPMVWYQKFEYAVGHWLQKTAEHVFGSVLCSPGCFSLFRGSALMDDNVLRRYTTTAGKASEYVQYDQGEDRWLCTLLLQQGWRVEYNAASDAYTNAPQEFKEFYNQRRRWGPSTLANTLDLLHSGKETSKRNSSISNLYILYQMFTVGSSILGPASVSLMIAGAFQFVFKMEGTIAIIVSVIPPVLYILICFITKPNFQITVAAILSVLYAFLMTASFFSIIGDMVIQQTFITPTGIFLVSMSIMYLVTAILHPQEFSLIVYGLMYFVCIPSGYLLLTIYSLVNMNIVSWGTRESNHEKAEQKNVGVLCDRNCKLCCWDVHLEVTQETENLVLQQMQNAVRPKSDQNITVPENQPSTEENRNNLHQEQLTSNTKNQQNILMKETSFKHRLPDTNAISKTEKESITKMEQDDGSLTDDSGRKTLDDEDDETNTYEEEDEYKEVILCQSDWVQPVKIEFLKKLTSANLKRNLQEHIRYTLRNKDQDDLCEELVLMLTDTTNAELKDRVGPEDVLSESQLEELECSLNEAARRILKTNRMQRLENRVNHAIKKTLTAPQVDQLTEDENDFWEKLIERYLAPIVEDKAKKDEVTRELKSLRNKATFLYFILNVLWVVATFFLQAIGDTISLKLPKYFPNGTKANETMNVEPLSLMFLLSFALLLIVQFLAMLYHRIYTLIHVVSYRSTEKDYKGDSDKEDDDGLELGERIEKGLAITNDDLLD
ncbi:hypothetical protein ANANG_G00044900 [Anguilla anguilla]|uniref:chitin synthase n=1 Tax=Anguilla anguilla TaxID=7936 RepID=A0A9D3S4Y9_ANGAN|nr:hypothetical protein ANANG_G00044900 [Anguilla anguilla]